MKPSAPRLFLVALAASALCVALALPPSAEATSAEASHASVGLAQQESPALEPSAVFLGKVTCDIPGSEEPSRTRDAVVVLDRPVDPAVSLGASGRSGRTATIRAAQVGGLAGSLVDSRRSQVTIVPSPSRTGDGSLGQVLGFKVVARSRSGKYREKGSWVVGQDDQGKVVLEGYSKVSLDSREEAWRGTCEWRLTARWEATGPMPAATLDALFAAPTGPALLGGAAGGCGAFMSQTTDLLYVASGILAACTPVSAVLSIAAVGTTIAGSAPSSACLTSQLDSMNDQLATQAAQIQQIDQYLGLATNVLYRDWYQVQLKLTQADAKSWHDNLAKISPSGAVPAAFGSFMNTGLGLWDDQLQPATGAVTDPQQLAVGLSDFQFLTLNSQIAAGEIAGFQSWVNEFSGTQAVLPTPGCSGCAVAVVPDSQSYLLKTYSQMFAALQANVDLYVPQAQAYNAVANQNVVPLYDEYNAMLVYFYQQAVVGLQQALTMEWLTNEVNYFRAAGTANKNQLPSWGEVRGTLYQYTGKSPADEAAAYNAAQKNLAKLYARRFNQLYLNTLNYVVSDVPVAPQAYPDAPISFSIAGKTYTGKPIDYAGEVGKSLPADASGSSSPEQGPTPLSLVPPVVANGPWKSAAVLYQFPGLYDVAACLSSLDAYTQAGTNTDLTMQAWLQTPGACPPVFALDDGSPMNQGVYDGNTLAPYTSFQPDTKTTGGPMRLAGTMANNLKFCAPTGSSLGWYAPGAAFVGNAAGLKAHTAYLNCGLWYTPMQSTSPCGFPRANCPTDNTTDSSIYDFGCASLINTAIANDGAGQGCTNNLSINGDKYPWILTLTDHLPNGLKSCAALIASVSNPSSVVRSPLYTSSRSESGSYLSGGSGCSIGFIGGGLNNHLPANACVDAASFGMRMANVTDSGGQGLASGWVLPMAFDASCSVGSPYTRLRTRQTSLAQDGYECVLGSNYDNTLHCTVLDGTQYVFTLYQQGSAIGLGVQLPQ